MKTRIRNIILLFILLCTGISPIQAQEKTPDYWLKQYHSSKVDSIQLEALRQLINHWKGPGYNQDSLLFYSHLLIQKAKKNKAHYANAYKGYYWVVSIYSNKNQSDSSLFYAFDAINLFREIKADYPLSVMLTMIGEEYRKLEQFDLALKYLHQAWVASETAENQTIRPGSANRLAATYFEAKDKQKSLAWADSSLAWGNKLGINSYRIKNYTIIGAIHRDLGNYQKASNIFNQALEESSGDTVLLFDILSNLGTLYAKEYLNQPHEVIKNAMPLFEMALLQNRKSYIISSSEQLASAYEQIGDYKQAYKYLRKYEQIRHEVFFTERDELINELNTRFDLQERDNEIEAQAIKIERSDLKIKNRNLIIITSFGLSSLLIVLLGVLFFNHKKRKETNVLLKANNEKIAEQKNEIEKKANQIEQAYQQLHELSMEKEAMINMLVHDLKNPLNQLTNIELFVEVEEKNKIVIQRSTEMLHMVMNMLDISKAENSQLQLELSKESIQSLVKESIEQVEYLAKPKEISLQYNLKNDYYVNADKGLFLRIIINLLQNAIRYSPRHAPIIVKQKILENKQLELSIIDQGKGISKKDHELIFDKYKQLTESQRKESGSTGLGLAFCKFAVEAHGWTIGVDSEINQGARFYIHIPDYQEKT